MVTSKQSSSSSDNKNTTATELMINKSFSSFGIILRTRIIRLSYRAQQKVSKRKDTHPAVNRETAKHLGERHFLIAPFFAYREETPCLHLACVRLKLRAKRRERRERRADVDAVGIC